MDTPSQYLIASTHWRKDKAVTWARIYTCLRNEKLTYELCIFPFLVCQHNLVYDNFILPGHVKLKRPQRISYPFQSFNSPIDRHLTISGCMDVELDEAKPIKRQSAEPGSTAIRRYPYVLYL